MAEHRCDWRMDRDGHGWTCIGDARRTTEPGCGRKVVAPDRPSLIARGLSTGEPCPACGSYHSPTGHTCPRKVVA